MDVSKLKYTPYVAVFGFTIIVIILLVFFFASRCMALDLKPIEMKPISVDSASTLLYGKELPKPAPIEPMKWDSITAVEDSFWVRNSEGKYYWRKRLNNSAHWLLGKIYMAKLHYYNSNPGDKNFPLRFAPLERIEYIRCVK